MVSWLNPAPRKRGPKAAVIAATVQATTAPVQAPAPVVRKNTFKTSGKSAKKKAGGQAIIDWVHAYCYVPDGKLLGQRLRLAPWQQQEIKNIYDNPADTRRAILSFGRKNGKGLNTQTLIPTPSGFVSIGKLEIGDKVFDEHGQICRVTYISPVHVGLRCWRLKFADGSEIVADEQHRWLTKHSYRPWASARVNSSGHGGRWRTDIMTTPQIAQSVHRQRRDGGLERNHKLPVAGALECPEVDLPIPPYVFGYWAGNGDSNGAVITVGAQDHAEILRELESELAFELKLAGVSGNNRNAPRYGLRRGREFHDHPQYSIQTKLRELGVLNNKHIPDVYKWASREQRLALLQGLMDSDGTASGGNRKAPRCCFDVMNKQLALDALHIVRSLGFKATIREERAKLHGRDVGAVWSVSFTAYAEDRVFRLQRRGACLPPRPEKSRRSQSNAIVACDEVASVPTVCIQVDSPSHLFLAGEGLTPTHNTSLAAVLLLVHLCGPRARANSSMYSTAQSREQASLIFHLAAKIVKMSPGLRSIITIKESAKELHCAELGTKYRALSAEASTAYGLSPVFAIHDELGQVRGPRSSLYEAIETATGAQEDPLSIIISTQAPTDADLLSVLIDDALGGHDSRVIVKLYTAPMALDPFAEDTIKLANPAFGNFLNPVEVMAMAEDARRMPSREAEFRNLILNQRVESSMPFVRPAQWAACGGDVHLEQATEVYAGLDLSEANDLTALVLIGRVDRVWHVRPWFWLPQEGLFDRARNDRVPYDKWAEQGFLETVAGNSITYDRIVPRLVQIFAQYKPRKVAFDRWNFKHLKPWLTHFGFSEQIITDQWVEFGQGTVSMSPALRELESCILDGGLAHGMHPILNMCASNAVVDSTDSSNRKLSKKRSAGRIDGMVALAMAFGVAPLKPTQVDIRTLIY
jgi:phage terminase large subunit-like protein